MTPSTQDMASVLLDLLAGRRTRADVARWARGYSMSEDDARFHAFDCLAGADRQMANGEWLFAQEDLEGWLFVLQARQGEA